MSSKNDFIDYHSAWLAHYGVMGMKWGVRRYQPYSTIPRKSGKGGVEKIGRVTSKDVTPIHKSMLKNSYNKNLDSWGKSADTNILYITGRGGSGKSTIANNIAQKYGNVNVVHLDTYFDDAGGVRDKQLDAYMEKHLPEYKMLNAPKDQISLNDWGKICEKFEVELDNYGKHQYKNGKRVNVEVVELLDDTIRPDKSYFKDKPIAILKTNAVKSGYRAMERDQIRFTKDEISNAVENHKAWSDDIKKFKSSIEDDKLSTKSIYKEAKRREPGITSDVVSSFEKYGGNAHGLENRLKSKESISRKAQSKEINDAVRYTAVLKDKDFVKSYNSIKRDLETKGYTETRCKNYFQDYKQGKVSHKSVQTNYRTPDGYTFEIQFQTKASQKAKDKKVPLYEEARNPNTSSVRKTELTRQMRVLADGVQDPPGIEKIKAH